MFATDRHSAVVAKANSYIAAIKQDASLFPYFAHD
jgi:hypothetical protein